MEERPSSLGGDTDDEEHISLRIVAVEHYMAPQLPKGLPGIEECNYYTKDGKPQDYPVIRVWGQTAAGQKAAVHVHGFFPYFYCRPAPEGDDEALRLFSYPRDPRDAERLPEKLALLRTSLEAKLREGKGAKMKHPHREYVRAIDIAHLTPFYGYHADPVMYARIELWRPDDVRTAAKLVMGSDSCFKYIGTHGLKSHHLQPHESHVDYLMRFFLDMGLHGLSPIFLRQSAVRFRYAPAPKVDDDDDGDHHHSRLEGAPPFPPPQTTTTTPLSQYSSTQHSETSEASFLNRATLWDERRVKKLGLFHAGKALRRRERSDRAIELDVAASQIENLGLAAKRGSKWGSKDAILKSLDELYEAEAALLDADGHSEAEIAAMLRVPDEFASPEEEKDEVVGDVMGPLAYQEKWQGSLEALRQQHIAAVKLAAELAAKRAANPGADPAAELPADPAAEPAAAAAAATVFEPTPDDDDELSQRSSSVVCDSDSSDDEESEDDERPIRELREDAYENASSSEEAVLRVAPRRRSSRAASSSSSSVVPLPYQSSPNDDRTTVLRFKERPPSSASLLRSLSVGGVYCRVVPEVEPRPVFASVPVRTRVTNRRKQQDERWFDTGPSLALLPETKRRRVSNKSLETWRLLVASAGPCGTCRVIGPARPPPGRRAVEDWLLKEHFTAAVDLKRRLDPHAWKSRPQVLSPLLTARSPNSKGSVARDGRSMVLASRHGGGGESQSAVSLFALETFAAYKHAKEGTRRRQLRADPRKDPLVAACYRYRHRYGADAAEDEVGAIVVRSLDEQGFNCCSKNVTVVATEKELMERLVSLVGERDPDLLVGWDMERESFAYLVDRAELGDIPNARFRLGREREEDRTTGVVGNNMAGLRPHVEQEVGSSSKYGEEGVLVRGRISMNGWRLVSQDEEAKMFSYTLEAASLELCKQRLPAHDWTKLGEDFMSGKSDRTLKHIMRRCSAGLAVLTALDSVGRACEMARLIGMPLHDALTRGSQHRVEAVLLRITKPRTQNAIVSRSQSQSGERAPDDGTIWYAVASPSGDQVTLNRGLGVIALTAEPQSAIYTEPVGVLDYQSLYPSVMIAHNLCFSTLICELRAQQPGSSNIEDIVIVDQQQQQQPKQFGDEDEDDLRSVDEERRGDDEYIETPLPQPQPAYFVERRTGLTTGRLGFLSLRSDATSAAALVDAERSNGTVYVPPSGGVFAPKKRREGVLPRLERELLAARFLTKAAMKRAAAKNRGTLVRVLNARQLALKLVANVTYGYATASKTGRQPCAELADAIVSSGKTYLEAAMTVAEDVAAEASVSTTGRDAVKYGDTDSLFVEFRGRTVESALELCTEVSRRVKAGTPRCLVLKREYVFWPCALVAKKTYAGMQYETANATPTLLTKGLETVRRDKCRFVRETQEQVLRVLLGTRDLALTRAAVLRAVSRAYSGRTSLSAFILRQEAKLGKYKNPDTQPAAVVANALNKKNGRVLFRERVEWIVTTDGSSPGLAKRCKPVRCLLEDPELVVDYAYYVNNLLIKPLNRILSLAPASADAKFWIDNHPKFQNRSKRATTTDISPRKSRIPHFFTSSQCSACDAVMGDPNRKRPAGQRICDACASRPQYAMLRAVETLKQVELRGHKLRSACAACLGASTLEAPRRCSLPSVAQALEGPCDSIDCEVRFLRYCTEDDLANAQQTVDDLTKELHDDDLETDSLMIIDAADW